MAPRKKAKGKTKAKRKKTSPTEAAHNPLRRGSVSAS